MPCVDGWQPGDLVWMKLRGFPRWPGRVVAGDDGLPRCLDRDGQRHLQVHSFGDHKYVWAPASSVEQFVPDGTRAQGKHKKVLQKALLEIREAHDRMLGLVPMPHGKSYASGLRPNKRGREGGDLPPEPRPRHDADASAVDGATEGECDVPMPLGAAAAVAGDCDQPAEASPPSRAALSTSSAMLCRSEPASSAVSDIIAAATNTSASLLASLAADGSLSSSATAREPEAAAQNGEAVRTEPAAGGIDASQQQAHLRHLQLIRQVAINLTAAVEILIDVCFPDLPRALPADLVRHA